MYPYFHQSWSLFAPVPKENFNVYVKAGTGKWEDVFQEIIRSHQTNRFAGNENTMLAFSNSLRYYISSVTDESAIMVNDESNINFEVLKRIIGQYYQLTRNSQPQSMDIIVVTKNTKSGKNYAHYYKSRN